MRIVILYCYVPIKIQVTKDKDIRSILVVKDHYHKAIEYWDLNFSEIQHIIK